MGNWLLIVYSEVVLSTKRDGWVDKVLNVMCAPFVGRFNFCLFSARGTEQAEQPFG